MSLSAVKRSFSFGNRSKKTDGPSATDAPVPYSLASRRPGDVASCYCDPSFAKDFLGWEATRDVGDMCRDTWRWQSGNPEGYKSGFLY